MFTSPNQATTFGLVAFCHDFLSIEFFPFVLVGISCGALFVFVFVCLFSFFRVNNFLVLIVEKMRRCVLRVSRYRRDRSLAPARIWLLVHATFRPSHRISGFFMMDLICLERNKDGRRILWMYVEYTSVEDRCNRMCLLWAKNTRLTCPLSSVV